VLHYAVRSMEFPSFEIKTEADSNDMAEYSHDDKPSTGMLDLRLCSVVKLTCCSIHRTHRCIVNLSNLSKYSIQIRWHELFNQHNAVEFEYHFACTHKGVNPCSILSLDKVIFEVLELWLSPLQWVLNWYVLTFIYNVFAFIFDWL